MRLRLFGGLHTRISGDGFRTIASEFKNDFVKMSFMSSLQSTRSHRSMLIGKQRRALRNFGESSGSRL
jgi:hypothetical protein